MVYDTDILKVTALNLKMNPAMSSPPDPMLQRDFVTYWTHAVLKPVFKSSCDFFNLNLFKIEALTWIWTKLFELSIWNNDFEHISHLILVFLLLTLSR